MLESPAPSVLADRIDEDVRFHEWQAVYLDSWRCTESVRVRFVVDSGSPSLASADFHDERLRLAKCSTPMGKRAGEPTELRLTGVGEVDLDRRTDVLQRQDSGAAPINDGGRDLRGHLPSRVVDSELGLGRFARASARARNDNDRSDKSDNSSHSGFISAGVRWSRGGSGRTWARAARTLVRPRPVKTATTRQGAAATVPA